MSRICGMAESAQKSGNVVYGKAVQLSSEATIGVEHEVISDEAIGNDDDDDDDDDVPRTEEDNPCCRSRRGKRV